MIARALINNPEVIILDEPFCNLDLKSKYELLMLEVNTQPGMNSLSLVPEQANHVGISFPELVSWLVENAQCD